jgi:hypothetical protein
MAKSGCVLGGAHDRDSKIDVGPGNDPGETELPVAC